MVPLTLTTPVPVPISVRSPLSMPASVSILRNFKLLSLNPYVPSVPVANIQNPEFDAGSSSVSNVVCAGGLVSFHSSAALGTTVESTYVPRSISMPEYVRLTPGPFSPSLSVIILSEISRLVVETAVTSP